MISRVCRVGAAVLASLTVAAACLAAESGGGPGQGGIGAQIGGSTFAIDRAMGSDWFVAYSHGASPRLAFDAHWRYAVSQRWRAQLATGFVWTGYSAKHSPAGVPTYPAPFIDPNFPSDPHVPPDPDFATRDGVKKHGYLALMLPVSLQLHYLGRHGWWAYHLGGGPGVYRVWVENHRKVLKDPVTLRLHRGLYPGASAEIGFEKWFKDIPAVSLEASIAGHLALAQRHDQFVSGFDSNVMAAEIRIGGNYYFVPGPRKAHAAAPKIAP